MIQSVETDDTLERWSFTIDKGDENEKANKGSDVEVDLKQVQQGIKDVVRQIVATSMYNHFLSSIWPSDDLTCHNTYEPF